MKKKTLHWSRFVLPLFLCLLFAVSAVAAPTQKVRIVCADSVGVGKPLPVEITSWYPIEDVRVLWNGAEIRPRVTERGGRYHVPLMLGIGLRGELGVYPIEATVTIWGKTYRFSKNVAVVESEWGGRR